MSSRSSFLRSFFWGAITLHAMPSYDIILFMSGMGASREIRESAASVAAQ